MDRAQSDGAFQTALTLAAAALALSLGGIWIGNVQFMRILDDGASSVFAMRTISLVLYGLFLIVAILVQKTHSKAHSKSIGTQTSEADALRREKTTMTSFMVVGLCLFVVAFLLDEFTSHALLALVLSKVVGLPLTIAVVLLFGRLPRTPMSRWIMLGSLGGFIVSALSISAAGILKMSFSGVVVLAFVLIAVSAACIRLGYSTLIRAKESDARAASGPHPVERSLPLTQAVTPIFAIALVIASLMLGYAQGSFTSIATANGIPVAISLVGAAIVLRLGFRDASTSFFFQAGLVCAAVSALLGTAHAGWASVASDITVTLASAMFESVVYILSAWAVLRAQSKIVAAALARFLVVLGHFGGTLLTTMESTLIALNIQSENASAITVLSLFILLLVAIYRVPSLQSMLLGSAEGADTGQGIPTSLLIAHGSGADASSGVTAAVPAASQPEGSLGKQHSGSEDDRHAKWDAACEEVARTYKLTPRETQVLGYVSRGRNTVFIQKEMILSGNTVKMHIRHIYAKLGVHSQQDVISIVSKAADHT